MSAPSASRVVAGRYQLETELGRGGMGVVWRATDTLIGRTVALKELRAPAGDRTSFVERALREARNAGRLNHPGIVAVHDVIAPVGDDDAMYIVMEYVEAPSLAEVIALSGPLPPGRVAALGVGILDALTAAHALGTVHRDVKPANVLVLPAGDGGGVGSGGGGGDRIKLTDFGIALAAEDTRLTRTGVMGTHAYLAPECFDDGQVGPATDLWALGATLFHAVAGRPPFERDTTSATLRAILLEEPPPPPCGPPLATAITGLLTRPVDQRLTSGAARPLLQQAVSTMPTVEAPPTVDPAGQAPWQSQSTSLHRAPAIPPPPGPPPGPPPPAPPLPPPSYGAPPSGPSPQRNNTPLILGILGVVAALVLVVVLVSSGGSDSDDDGGGGSAATGQTPLPGANPTDPTDPAAPAAGGDPAMADGQALAQQFLDLVNGGDADAAIAMLCTAGVDNTQDYADNITEVAGDAALQIDPGTAELVSQGVVYAVDLTGSVHGDSVSRAHVSAAARDNCIVTFSAS